MRFAVLTILAAVLVVLAILRSTGVLDARPTSARDLAAAALAEYELAGESALPAGEPLFTDIASAAGLVFRHDRDAHGRFFLPEGIGPGVGLLDYDGDGDLDIFVAGGGAIVEGAPQSCRLFRNDGTTFADVTTLTRADVSGPAYGIACADYDDDGDTDIYITRLGGNVLLRNDGAGGFDDVSAAAGVDDESWGTSAAFLDFDRDGDLDLYVANYVAWSAAHESRCYSPQGTRDYCNPTTLPPSSDRLFRNRGDGTFDDVTESAGIAGDRGNGLGVLVADFDDDGWPDIYVANDQTPAFLWHNSGGSGFVNTAVAAGCAYDGAGVAIAGMGVAGEDFDRDGDLDLLVTNIRDQSHLMLRNDRTLFTDIGVAAGLARWSRPATGFGVAVFDQDHDGRLDMFVANGAVNRTASREHAVDPYAERDQFLRWNGSRFEDASAALGITDEDTGRGVAVGDLDNDGDQDLVVSNNGGPLRLYRNDNRSGGSWLLVDVRTRTGRHAIGARVTAVIGSQQRAREVRPQQSYLSSSDPRVHFGLGDATVVDELLISWPDGTRTSLRHVPVDQVIRVDPTVGEQVE